MLPSLDYKPNLYDIDDMEIEEFRDFLTDMFYGDKKFMEKGYTKDFGHENQLETVSHTTIPSNLLDSKFLSGFVSFFINSIKSFLDNCPAQISVEECDFLLSELIFPITFINPIICYCKRILIKWFEMFKPRIWSWAPSQFKGGKV